MAISPYRNFQYFECFSTKKNGHRQLIFSVCITSFCQKKGLNTEPLDISASPLASRKFEEFRSVFQLLYYNYNGPYTEQVTFSFFIQANEKNNPYLRKIFSIGSLIPKTKLSAIWGRAYLVNKNLTHLFHYHLIFYLKRNPYSGTD